MAEGDFDTSVFSGRHEQRARDMSLRDWFAGQALAGMLAAADCDSVLSDVLANCAYRIADGMLAERQKAGA